MAPPSWDERFAEYQRNKKQGVVSNSGQHSWVHKQRKMYANGTLPDEHKEKLNCVGFEWIATPNHRYDCEAWNESFKLLETHHQKHGNCFGPFSHRKLDNWVQRQRSTLKRKKSLTEVQQERRALLNTLGFWDAYESQFEPSAIVESGLDPTARASRTTTSTSARSDREMGQGPSGSGIDGIAANDVMVSDGYFLRSLTV
jgi:Helicase associated domain